MTADVTDATQVQAMVSRVVEHFGRLDYAVNNAGVINERGAAHELAEEEWDRQIAVNLTAVWLCMKHELVPMLDQRAGAIVNLSSVAGLRAAPGLAAYNARKHGVVGLSKGTGVEHAAQGIRVNAICPGWVETPMTADYGSDAENRAMMIASEPIGRTAQPEEIAETAVWLCSGRDQVGRVRTRNRCTSHLRRPRPRTGDGGGLVPHPRVGPVDP